MSNSTVLVTGGAGFIGSNLVRRLLHEGHIVRVLDDLSSGYLTNLDGLEVEFIEGSVATQSAVERAVSGVDQIVHLAARPSVPKSIAEPMVTDLVNTHGTLMLLEAARHHKISHFVFAGSSAIYGDAPESPKHEGMLAMPMSPYAVTKLAGESYVSQYARLFGLNAITLRFFNVFGPRQDPNGAYAPVIARWGRAVLDGQPIQIFGDGLQTRDFCFVDNILDAIVQCLGSTKLTGLPCNISGGTSVTLLELADLIGEVTGKEVTKNFCAPRLGDIKDSLANIGRARSVLGFSPRVSLRSGLVATLQAL